MKRASATATAAKRMLRGPFARLIWHFLTRLFTGEFARDQGDRGYGIGLMLALAALPGAFASLLLSGRYSSLIRWLLRLPPVDYNTFSIPDKYMFVAYTMVVTGLVTLIQWDNFSPDRLDYANLAQLPASGRQIFFAKFAAMLLFVSLFVGALNVFSTVLFPLQVMGNQRSMVEWLRFVLGHVAATVGGSFFAFFFFLGLSGFLLCVLPYHTFRKVSQAIQFLAATGLVALLFVTPEIQDQLPHLGVGSHGFLRSLPTIWFLGMYQTLSGHPQPMLHGMEAKAATALAIAAVASLTFYLAGYGRSLRRIRETPESAAPEPSRFRQGLTRMFDRRILGCAFDRACFHFATRTLARSQRHRLILAGVLGLGAAIAMQDFAAGSHAWATGLSGVPSAVTLAAPLALVFFLLAGMRFLFNLPAELPANWIFQIAAEGEGVDAGRVARKLMFAFLVPILLICLACFGRVWGARVGSEEAVVLLTASLILMEGLLANYSKIPFTSGYGGLEHNIGLSLAIGVPAFFVFSPGMAWVESWAFASSGLTPILVLIGSLVAGWAGVHWYAIERPGAEAALVFVDDAEPFVPSMDLR